VDVLRRRVGIGIGAVFFKEVGGNHSIVNGKCNVQVVGGGLGL